VAGELRAGAMSAESTPTDGRVDPRFEPARLPPVQLAVHQQETAEALSDSEIADVPPSALLQAPEPVVTSPGPLEPRTVDEALHPPVPDELIVSEAAPYEIDLTSALAMAGGQNMQIAVAAARYQEAYARYEASRILWLPSLRVGASFNHHEGPLQATDGSINDISRSSLQAGLGARAVGAGTPMVPGLVAEFHTTDAVFQPKIAIHAAAARQAATETATNDALLATALAYNQLLRAVQELRIAEQTRDHAAQLYELTTAFANSGQGPQADADRAQTELVLRRNDVARAEEAIQVASARLTELVRLDPGTPLVPLEPAVVPIDLVSFDRPVGELLATGLSNRPELAEAQHLVCEAVHRYRREQCAPFLPSVLLGVSQSEFGGGLGSSIHDSSGRFDFDASAHWELRNLGLGERARRDVARSLYNQATTVQVQTMDRVAREIVEAQAQVRARRKQIAVAESGIGAATGSYQRNLDRIREAQGLPIEALQSLQALDQARREYLRAVTDYNEAQFRLQRALGWPIQ